MWNQIKDNSPGSSFSSPKASGGAARQFQQPTSGSEGPLRILNPMSEQDEAERRSQRQLELEDEEDDVYEGKRSGRWQRAVERAITNLSAEVAALREQITTGREWRSRKDRSLPAWVGWVAWAVFKHLFVDFIVLSIVLLWMRRRGDRRLEDLVRASLRLIREYIRKVLPSR